MPISIWPRQPLPSGSGEFASVTHDSPETQTAWGSLMPTADSLTASITAGSSYFTIVQLDACKVTWETVIEDPNDGELPVGHAPVKISGTEVPTLTPIGSSNGITPVAVEPGQWVGLDVRVDVPQDASLPPGIFNGTAVIQGGSFSHTVALQCLYLAVLLDSPIGLKWQALGGEATLGAVLDLPHTAPDGKGIVQTFVKGVLYQVPVASGSQAPPAVYFMSTAVYAKWVALADETDVNNSPVWNVLGYPAEDTFATVEGGQALGFEGGVIVVRANTQAWVVYGAIYAHYEQFGNLKDPSQQPWIGLPTSDEAPVDPIPPVGPQRFSTFDGGDIFWSSATGAWEMHGAILQHWPGVSGSVGLPTSDQTGAPDGAGQFNLFQDGAIYWSPATGACMLTGPILDRWGTLKGVNSYLGYPTSDVAPWTTPPAGFQPGQSGDICSFQFGQIAVATDGTILEMPATLTETVSGSTGVPFGNLSYSATMTIQSNGTYTISFHVADNAPSGYEFQLSAALTASEGVWLGAVHSGSVAGNAPTATGSTTDDHTETDSNKWITGLWQNGAFLNGVVLNATLDYQANSVIGFIENQAKAIAETAVTTAVAGPVGGAMVLLGAEAAQAGLGIPGAIGIIAGMAVLAFGGGVILAVAAGVVAGEVAAANISTREISPSEYDYANNVFHGTLPPMSQIMLTNLYGLNGRFFTFPGPDGNIYVNLGSAFSDPMGFFFSGPNVPDYPRQGEVFIHELTHAWQFHNSPDVPYFLCQVGVTQIKNSTGTDVYSYGPPTTAWGDFNPEAQAAVVDKWFGGVIPWSNGVQSPYTPDRVPTDNEDPSSPTFGVGKDPHTQMPVTDPYFHYIQDNIRTGTT